MKLFCPRQTESGETRVALVPGVVSKITKLGADVLIESGAGLGSQHDDDQYKEAGATIVKQGDDEIWSQADVVVTIHLPDSEQTKQLKEGAVLTGMLAALKHPDQVTQLQESKVTSFAMEFVPRITRAQAMDVLSSQASIGGYVAVVLAAEACPKIFPMMMTAAGTIAPARVMVIGAGVAGLQAIATAKRLGAVVEAYDIRPAVKEQVESLGGRFIDLPIAKKDTETAGGYAKEQSEDERKQQQDLMAKHVIASDVVVTTAAIFGKAPPMLIPKDVVGQMKRGSLIVDLAADTDAGRGNCEMTKPGERFETDNGVLLIGETNMPAMAPVHASQVYAANMVAFLREIIAEGKIELTLDDEIQKAALITHDDQVINELVAESLKASD
jgi:NAD(P) transhydrogenase subunit alpha